MDRRALLLIGSLLFQLGCGETPTQSPVDSPLFAISDAVHDGGNEYFYWLPPMVGNPQSVDGTFDGTLSPVVTVCDLADCMTNVIAEYTTTTGPGSETVRVVPEDEQYVVNWHTNDFEVSSGPTYRISVRVAGTELGFLDVQLASNGGAVKNLTTDEIVGLKDGRTLPIKFRIEEGALRVVGPGGGTLTLSGGSAVLSVPAGAVAEYVEITADPVTLSPPDPRVVPGTAFEFGPDELTFDAPATLTISYDPSLLPPGTDEDALVLGHLIGGGWTVATGSTANTATHTVSGPVSGFSSWAILRPPPPAGPFAYTSDADGDNEVYVWDGGATRKVTDNTVDDGGPDWLEDRIVFHSARTGTFDIWVVDELGGSPVNLTATPGAAEFGPHWSPDGRRVAYSRLMSDGTFDIWVMNGDGSGQVNLTDNPGTDDAGAAWSPDGSQIAFQSRSGGSLEVYVMNSDGSGSPTQLTFDASNDDGAPDWSPDGQRLTFSKFVPGTGGHIWTMNAADGSEQEQLTSGVVLDYNPAWSADGSQILFERFSAENLPSGMADIRYLTVADGLVGSGAVDPSADERSPGWKKEVSITPYSPGLISPLSSILFSRPVGNSTIGTAFADGEERAFVVGSDEVDDEGVWDIATKVLFNLSSTTTEVFEVRICSTYGDPADPSADRVCADHQYLGLEHKSFDRPLSLIADGVARPFVVQAVSETDEVLETFFSGSLKVTEAIAPTQAPVLSASATTVSSGDDFELTWTAPEGNTSFHLQESQDPTFTSVTSSTTLSGLSRTYNRTVVSSTTFYFRVRSSNPSGVSPWSNVVEVTVIP